MRWQLSLLVMHGNLHTIRQVYSCAFSCLPWSALIQRFLQADSAQWQARFAVLSLLATFLRLSVAVQRRAVREWDIVKALFALFWEKDMQRPALRMVTSPSWGLETAHGISMVELCLPWPTHARSCIPGDAGMSQGVHGNITWWSRLDTRPVTLITRYQSSCTAQWVIWSEPRSV